MASNFRFSQLAKVASVLLVFSLVFPALFSGSGVFAEEEDQQMRKGRIYIQHTKGALINTLIRCAEDSRYQGEKWSKKFRKNDPEEKDLKSRDFDWVALALIAFGEKHIGAIRDQEGNVIEEARQFPAFKVFQSVKIGEKKGSLELFCWKHPTEPRTIVFSFTFNTYAPRMGVFAGYRLKMKFPTGVWEEVPFINKRGNRIPPRGELDNDEVKTLVNMVYEVAEKVFSEKWMRGATGQTR